jgi:hypothetical protein
MAHMLANKMINLNTLEVFITWKVLFVCANTNLMALRQVCSDDITHFCAPKIYYNQIEHQHFTRMLTMSQFRVFYCLQTGFMASMTSLLIITADYKRKCVFDKQALE